MATETEAAWDWSKMQKYRVLAFTDKVKVLWALKIALVEITDDGAELTPADPDFASFFVSSEYMDKHDPEEGGYYICYKGGYESFCSVEQFEAGHEAI